VSRKAGLAPTNDFTREELEVILDEAKRAEEAKLAKATSWTVTDLAKQFDIPPGFIIMMNDKPYVTKEGLLYKAKKIGFRSIEARIEEDGKGGYEARAEIHRILTEPEIELLRSLRGDRESFKDVWDQLSKPTVAHGSATPDNVNLPALRKGYMKELAETRAINRALRLYTGCGMVSVEELPETEARA
jgi:hypothetical protein